MQSILASTVKIWREIEFYYSTAGNFRAVTAQGTGCLVSWWVATVRDVSSLRWNRMKAWPLETLLIWQGCFSLLAVLTHMWVRGHVKASSCTWSLRDVLSCPILLAHRDPAGIKAKRIRYVRSSQSEAFDPLLKNIRWKANTCSRKKNSTSGEALLFPRGFPRDTVSISWHRNQVILPIEGIKTMSQHTWVAKYKKPFEIESILCSKLLG